MWLLNQIMRKSSLTEDTENAKKSRKWWNYRLLASAFPILYRQGCKCM